jgi:hypothetical protein
MNWPSLKRVWILVAVPVIVAGQIGAGRPVVVEIDGAKRHAISPYIYGTNQPDWQGPSKYLTLTRWGGNRITAYNWETNASNAGSDWQHQNDGFLSPSNLPGEPVRKFVADARAAGAAVVVTVPMAGYVAADKAGGGDVKRTPDYLKTRFLVSLPSKKMPFHFPPELGDGRVFQDEFVWWLEKTFARAGSDSPPRIFYALDNEPDLWSGTHARIHPQKASYEEVTRRGAEYAAAIKAVAPKALVFGPVNYGWQGMVNLQDAPDGHGRDFLEFYLHEMQLAEQRGRHRLLDVLDVHWYPEAQGGNVRVSEDDARPEVAAARVQAPRSLWDPTYTEKSWITQWSTRGPIRLLPRLREKIEKNYPGTRLGITEYYYGGGGDISGGLAEADVLGIFGREDVFAAALWHTGRTDDRFIHAALAMYRNYDGRGGGFGDTGLAVQNVDPERTSVFASLTTRDQVVLVAINKSSEAIPLQIRLNHCPRTMRAAVFRLTQAAPRPVRGDDLPAAGPGRQDASETFLAGCRVNRCPYPTRHRRLRSRHPTTELEPVMAGWSTAVPVAKRM